MRCHHLEIIVFFLEGANSVNFRWRVDNYLMWENSIVVTFWNLASVHVVQNPTNLGCFLPHVISTPGKIDLRPETRTKQLEPILDLTSEIDSLGSRPKTQSDLNRAIPEPKFSTKLLIFTWQAYWIKNWLTRSRPVKFTWRKMNGPEIPLNLKHDRIQT